MSCEGILSLLGISIGTYFWMWYLVYEYEVAKGIRETDTAWWNTTLRLPSAHLVVAGLIVLVTLWAAVSILGVVYGYEPEIRIGVTRDEFGRITGERHE